MSTPKHSAAQAVYDVVVEQLVVQDRCEAGKMFGMPCIQCKGKAVAGFWQDAMVFKLADTSSALKVKGAHLFDSMGGRPMKQWVVIPFAQGKEWLTFGKKAVKELQV